MGSPRCQSGDARDPTDFIGFQPKICGMRTAHETPKAQWISFPGRNYSRPSRSQTPPPFWPLVGVCRALTTIFEESGLNQAYLVRD
jgi:hypothetical protein